MYRVIAHGRNAEVAYRGRRLHRSFGDAHAEALKVRSSRSGLQDVHVVKGGKIVWEVNAARKNPQVTGKCKGCGHTKPLFHNREAGKMCRSCLVAVERYGRSHMADAFEDEDTGRPIPFPVKPVTDKRRNPGRGRPRPRFKGTVCPCGCRGSIKRHDDRSQGCWPCPKCGDDSDRDLGLACSSCAGRQRRNPIDRVAELREKVRSIRDEMESILGNSDVVQDLDIAEVALRRGSKADLDEASWRVLNVVDSIQRAGVGGYPHAIDRPFARLHRLAKRFAIIADRGIPSRKNPSKRELFWPEASEGLNKEVLKRARSQIEALVEQHGDRAWKQSWNEREAYVGALAEVIAGAIHELYLSDALKVPTLPKSVELIRSIWTDTGIVRLRSSPRASDDADARVMLRCVMWHTGRGSPSVASQVLSVHEAGYRQWDRIDTLAALFAEIVSPGRSHTARWAKALGVE